MKNHLRKVSLQIFFELLDTAQKMLTDLKVDSVEDVAKNINTARWTCFIAFANNPQMAGILPKKERKPGVKIGNCEAILEQLKKYKDDASMQEIIKNQGKDFVSKLTSLIPYIYRDSQSQYISFDELKAEKSDPVYKQFELNTCPDNKFASCKTYDLLMDFLTLAIKAKEIFTSDKKTLTDFAPNLLYHFTEHFREGLLYPRENVERIKNCVAVLSTLKIYLDYKEINSEDKILDDYKSQYVNRIVNDLANPAVARFAAAITKSGDQFDPASVNLSDFKKMLEHTDELWTEAIKKDNFKYIYKPIIDAYNAAVDKRDKYKAAIEKAPSDDEATWVQKLAKTTKKDYEQSTKDVEKLVDAFKKYMIDSNENNIMPEDWKDFISFPPNEADQEEYTYIVYK
jgi:hypothetical protein